MFVLLPIGYGFFVSLHEFDGFGPMKWIGLENYSIILSRDMVFRQALLNTVLFAVGVVIGKNVIGLALAFLVNQPLKGMTVFRTAFFLPVTMNVLVIGSFWTFFLSSSNGLLAETLRALGLEALAIGWLSDERFALLAVIGVEIWRWVGLHMLIYLAGLQDIPEELYEVARLDGASGWTLLTKITIPMIRPIIFVSTLLALMGAFVRNFDLVWVLTRGGPGTASEVVLTRVYNEAFQFGRLGRASAMGYILFAIVAVIAFVYVRQARSGRVDY
ncbi:MAG: sugar ABC transporter permease [Chloroflexi bacterium]|nr:sugar ABC transporter permease [Chloroflexota bacterium]